MNTSGANHNTGLNSSIEHMRSGDYSALSTDSFNVGNDVSRQNQQLDSFSSVEPESFIQSNYSNTTSGFDLTTINQCQPRDRETSPSTAQPRRSTRVRKPPDKYGEWVVNDLNAQVWYV